jgi:electron transport complex protein RnfE
MEAYLPSLHAQLGIYIPLIVVNCIILGRAEAFASKNNIVQSLLDGLGMGIGFTIALALLGGIREILGTGAILNYNFIGDEGYPILLFIMPPGAFLALAALIMIYNKISGANK